MSTLGYDADAKAKRRADAPITVGGETLHARPQTNALVRELRKTSREQRRLNVRVEAADQLADLLDSEGDKDEIKRLTARVGSHEFGKTADGLLELVDELNDQATVLTYQLAAAQLQTDDGSPVERAFLEQHLAIDDVVGLVRFLRDFTGEDPQVPETIGTTSG